MSRSTIILHGSTSQKTNLNFILVAVGSLNLTRSTLLIFMSHLTQNVDEGVLMVIPVGFLACHMYCTVLL
jgi:hypothetical protein